jgi:hypothetical protein
VRELGDAKKTGGSERHGVLALTPRLGGRWLVHHRTRVVTACSAQALRRFCAGG